MGNILFLAVSVETQPLYHFLWVTECTSNKMEVFTIAPVAVSGTILFINYTFFRVNCIDPDWFIIKISKEEK